MKIIRDVTNQLESLAPTALAEEWDNVGLLVGDLEQPVQKVMTCLTVTPDSAAEAIDRGAQLIVTHHPLPFRPLERITTDSTTGRLLWQLIGGGVSIYSAHTAFDSAGDGINHQLAQALGLIDVAPLVASEDDPTLGTGRFGCLPQPLAMKELASRLSTFVGQPVLRGVPPAQEPVRSVAVACGSAGQFIAEARTHQCQLLVTGETSFHTCLEAAATGVGLLLLGHFASERFAVVRLAERLQESLPSLEIWACHRERDPIQIL